MTSLEPTTPATVRVRLARIAERVVPKERVRLGKETEVSEQQVSEEVRKERIEADGEIAEGGERHDR